ncbi:hypothetical protein BC832DRAFT_107314 [Gaertneriomyces semiglobifer]|nr:hypothetical protein BC832DRAFT_107314 [Gaertneriomyces semiglobifer]
MLMNQKDRPPGSWRTSVAGKRIAWVFLAILLVLLRVPGTSGQMVDVDVNVTVYTEPNYSGIAVKLYDEGLYISDDNGNTFLGSIKIRNGWQALIYQGRGRNGSPLAALYYDTPSLENIGLNIMTSWTLYPSKPTIYHDQPECPGPNFNSSTKPCDCKPGYYGSRCQYECPDCGPIVYPSDPAYPDFEAQKVTTEANGGYLLRSGACRGGVKGDGKCLCGPAYTPGPDGRCSVKRQNFRLNNAVATGANGVLHEQIGCVGGCGFNGICNTAIKRCQCHFGWTSPASGTPCSVCAPGFYKDKDGDCVRCWKGCIECYDTTGYCKTCLPGTKLVNDPANPLENQLVCIPKTKPDGTSFCSKGWFWNDVECKSADCCSCNNRTLNGSLTTNISLVRMSAFQSAGRNAL